MMYGKQLAGMMKLVAMLDLGSSNKKLYVIDFKLNDSDLSASKKDQNCKRNRNCKKTISAKKKSKV